MSVGKELAGNVCRWDVGELAIFVKGDEDEGVFHEVLVVQHGVHDVGQVCFGECDVCVVRVVLQIRHVVHVLRCVRALGNIEGEVGLGVDDVLASSGAVLDVEE